MISGLFLNSGVLASLGMASPDGAGESVHGIGRLGLCRGS